MCVEATLDQPRDTPGPVDYSVSNGAHAALRALVAVCRPQLPCAFEKYVDAVSFSSPSPIGDLPCIPCPLREQECAAALKALEGCASAALADLRYGAKQGRTIDVDSLKTTAFLMSAYITTLDGMGKAHPKIKYRLPDTDLNRAQSDLYRRLSANLYETSNPRQYYHIHGSLEASTTLRMLGLPPYLPGPAAYRQCIQTIESAVKRFSIPELEHRNQQCGQAGAPALTQHEFRQTAHGEALATIPPFTQQPLETLSPPAPFPAGEPKPGAAQCLAGIRVIELCRIIAGPTIARSLAAHGASVLKVTSAQLPDVPFFQVDVNTGKHATSLHLKEPHDRALFEDLLTTADVIIDGYRPGALANLGYGPEHLAAQAARRGRGIVYVAEDCFGGLDVPGAEWARRPGWQQIADCVTGVAWEQGWFMGKDEPVIPPFPMSDYGTGTLGTVAALTGLYSRAMRGGSWLCRTSLAQYNLFLLSLGAYPPDVLGQLWDQHDGDFFALRHHDSVDEVSRCALKSLRRLRPALFADNLTQRAFSPGFNGEVRWPREPLAVSGIKIGYVRPTRPNGFDSPSWEGWERDEALLNDA